MPYACRYEARISLVGTGASEASTGSDDHENGVGSRGEGVESQSEAGGAGADTSVSGDSDADSGSGTTDSSGGDSDTLGGDAADTAGDDLAEEGTDDSGGGGCQLPDRRACDAAGNGNPFHAMGLGCSSDPAHAIVIEREEHASDDLGSWRVLAQYGNATWQPQEGTGMLMLSTGQLPVPDPPESRYISMATGRTDSAEFGDTANPDGVQLPLPMRLESGSSGGPFAGCDGVNDCSDTLATLWDPASGARDLQYLRFETRVPQGVHSFSLKVAWFSAEFPRRMNRDARPYDDAFVFWMTGREFTGNVAVLPGQKPMNAWGLANHVLNGGGHLPHNSTALLNTGFQGTTGRACAIQGWDFGDCPRGAASGWLRLAAPVSPGETIVLAAALFDQGDEQYDTVVLLDDFRWHCQACSFESGCAGLSSAEVP